jgi:nucleotide-binding universal stress UspA family protein
MVAIERLTHPRRRVRRLAQRAAVPHRVIVVPLLGRDETEHALVLACRLAVDRNARVLLLAPLQVEAELPLDARFDDEERELKDWLARVRAYAESYGIRADTRIVRTRNFGLDVAEEAEREDADLIVVSSPILSRRGFDVAFPEVVMRILRHANCQVLIDTGEVAGGDVRAA